MIWHIFQEVFVQLKKLCVCNSNLSSTIVCNFQSCHHKFSFYFITEFKVSITVSLPNHHEFPCLGVPLIDGGTVRLPKLIGLSRALDLILTGRPVSANEAFDIGLANKVVPKGKALEEATKLAKELMQFPQQCMLADRESAYNVAFEADSLESALKFEFENGIKVIREESVLGAKQFVSGKGKHGSFESKL